MEDRYPRYDDILDWYAADGDDPGHSYFGQHDHAMRKPRTTPTSTDPLHVSEPVFLGREVEYVNDCLERRWLTQGRYVGRLERGFAEFTQRRFGVACNSGTAALHLAMLSLGVGPDDIVLVPALSYIATANCVTYCGAIPVFVDVDRDTWCMDPADVRRKVARLKMGGQMVRGAIAVHLFDAVADVDAIRDALPDEAFVVEDAAQAHGADYRGRPVGSLGEVATFSFYASKTMAAGEGGMLVTDNDVTVEAARLFRGQGADRSGAYEHSVVGYNYRMNEIAGAIALAQLETFEEHSTRRATVINQYATLLPATGVTLQQDTPGTQGGAWSCGVILPKGNPRQVVREQLMVDHGIETRPFFVPLPYTKAYQAEHGQATCPVSIQLAHRGMNLPTHAGMTAADVLHVVTALGEVLR